MKRLLIAIGVNSYRNGIPALRWAVQDAVTVGGCFQHRLGFDRVVILVGADQLNASQLKERIRGEAAGLEAGDLIAVFFAGHATQLRGPGLDEQVLLLPGADPGLMDRFHEVLDLKSLLSCALRPGVHRWLIIDGCRTVTTPGERVFAGKRRVDGQVGEKGFAEGCRRVATAAGMETPVWVLNSCGDGQVAVESDELEGGLFTRALLGLLTGEVGRAVDERGRLLAQVDSLLAARMQALAVEYDLVLRQFPTLVGAGERPFVGAAVDPTLGGGGGFGVGRLREWGTDRLEPHAAGVLFELGRRRGYGGDWAGARPCFEVAANLGHATAASLMGQCLMHGQGGDRDVAGAERWFRRALEMRPLPAAWNNLGVLLQQSGGAERMAAAGPCFLAAAQLGHAKGMFNYALHLVRNGGDIAAALRWLDEAELAGSSEAGALKEQLQRG